MAVQKLAHAEIRVPDVGEALEFHVEILGLTEIARAADTVYLGCGVDGNYDLALTPGGTGAGHFALQVASEDELAGYRQRLSDLGSQVEELSDGEPGQAKALRFSAPSGHVIELVVLADSPSYLRPSAPKHPRHRGIAPLDLDHITLRAQDVRGLAEFLQQALDFKVSDVFQPAPDVWAAAWTRAGEYHHDVAVLGAQNEGETLDHVAWTMDGSDHIKRSADQLAQQGITLEAGPGRHGLGGNLFAYFWAPGGNRYELSAEMPRTVDPSAATGIWDDFPQAFSAWGQMPPESFGRGS